MRYKLVCYFIEHPSSGNLIIFARLTEFHLLLDLAFSDLSSNYLTFSIKGI